MAFVLESPAFKEGEAIPRRYACDGDGLSPPLKWTDPPDGTKALALILDDPDAPVMTWVHWVVSFIPVERRELKEGLAPKEVGEGGIRQAITSWRRVGYGGPCPPGGKTHRYFFRLYALSIVPDVRPGDGRKGLEKAMAGHVLAEAQLMGRYARS